MGRTQLGSSQRSRHQTRISLTADEYRNEVNFISNEAVGVRLNLIQPGINFHPPLSLLHVYK